MHRLIKAMEGKNRLPKTPVKMNEQSGKETNYLFTFSDLRWGSRTRKLTERVQKCMDSQIMAIVEDVWKVKLMFTSREATVASELNRYNDVCKPIHSEITILTDYFGCSLLELLYYLTSSSCSMVLPCPHLFCFILSPVPFASFLRYIIAMLLYTTRIGKGIAATQ